MWVIERLVQEAVVTVPRDLIAQAIEVLVFIDGRGDKRRVTAILELDGLDDEGEYALKPLDRPSLRTVSS